VTYDFIVIGGGIVGIATARALLARRPGAKLAVLEKEDGLAGHQTGHNSGVIHAGVYYEPGSLKARLCAAGERATKEFCAENDIPFRVPGKLVVATSSEEVTRMHALAERARANGLRVREISRSELHEREPNVRGLAALHVPATGIVGFAAVTAALGEQVRRLGGEIQVGTHVSAMEERPDAVVVHSEGTSWTTRQVVACAGLQADRVARSAGIEPAFRIVPFRGEYYRLPAYRNGLVSHLIYPVPDPDLPFLGVHLTQMIDGSVTVGPNAVLSMSREGYARGSVTVKDIYDWATFGGTWRFARRNVRPGLSEVRGSLSRRAFLARCRRYAPDLTLSDLDHHQAGIRAQAMLRDGRLIHDFWFEATNRTLHVCNAPSPAATSAIPIAEMIANRLLVSMA
jgi:L-2-hydroxyglutarate oxidase